MIVLDYKDTNKQVKNQSYFVFRLLIRNFEANMETMDTNIPYHIPVMLHETVDGLAIEEGGVYADMTFGGGGHSREILRRADKPAAVANDAKQRAEISSLNLCRGAKEGNC